MIEDNETIIHTQEVTEILTATPSWLYRWGISVILILIFLAISLSYYIKYPDVLTAEINLTTLNPPVTLISKTNGKLSYLFVKNNGLIKNNQIISIIENTANYKDILQIEKKSYAILKSLELNNSMQTFILPDNLNVGELFPFYLPLLKTIKDVNLYNNVNPFKRQITLLQKDLISYTDLLAKYRKQESIHKEQLTLVEKDYNRNNVLNEKNVISQREYDIKKSEYLSALNSNEQFKINVSNAIIQINSIKKNILQLQIQDYQEQEKLQNELSQNLKALVSEINKWKQLYLIKSPIDGKISFFSVWAVNQNIKQGDELFSVIPNKRQEFIGKCILPIVNTGKLMLGQKVNIKLDNYPYNEIGMLEGRVSNISDVPNKNTYAIDVTLNKGLVTSYNKTLTYKEEMKGRADIITKNISIMDRVFFNFKKLLSNQ